MRLQTNYNALETWAWWKVNVFSLRMGKKLKNAEWQIFNLTTNTLLPCDRKISVCCWQVVFVLQRQRNASSIWSITVGPYGSHTRTPSGGPNSTYYTQINRRRHQTVLAFPPLASHSRAEHVRICVSFIVRFTGQNLDPADIRRKVSLLVKTSSIRESSGFHTTPQMCWYSIRLFVWHCEHKQKSHDHFKDYSC